MIPQDAILTPRPANMPAWDSLDAKQKELYARMAEIYAAFLAYDDYNIGRVIDAVKQEGLTDNTLIIFIEGDNGGSAEGTLQGTANEVAIVGNGVAGEFRLPLLDQGRAGRSAPLQPYAGAVVLGVRYAIPVDQTIRQPFRRHTQRYGDELAEAHQGRRRASASSFTT